jgi:hypothetical protein
MKICPKNKNGVYCFNKKRRIGDGGCGCDEIGDVATDI